MVSVVIPILGCHQARLTPRGYVGGPIRPNVVLTETRYSPVVEGSILSARRAGFLRSVFPFAQTYRPCCEGRLSNAQPAFKNNVGLSGVYAVACLRRHIA